MDWIIPPALALMFLGLQWYIAYLLIKKNSIKVASIAITACYGVFILFFVVFANIQAKAAQQQVEVAEGAVAETKAEAQKQTEIAERATEEARLAQLAILECQNSK